MVEKIDHTASILPPNSVAGGDGNAGGGRQRQQESPAERPAIIDVASIFGAAGQPIPPAVQDSIMQLMAEVERLRDEVDRLKRHETYLLETANHHPLLPALTRRAFMTGLKRILEASERADLPGSLAFFHLDGLEKIRQLHGMQAGDAMLSFVASRIHNELRQTDLLGYFDVSDFAVVLALANHHGVTEKITLIMNRLHEAQLEWEGQKIQIRFLAGVVHFQAGMSAEQLVVAAYRLVSVQAKEGSQP